MTDYANGSSEYIPLIAYLSGTNTLATGLTLAITISKNGGAFVNPAAGATNATEISNGCYYFAPTSTDTTTNGPLIVKGTAATADTVFAVHAIVPATNGRKTSLPATACTTNASLLTSGTGTDQLSVTSGAALSTVNAVNAAASNIKKNQALSAYMFLMTDNVLHKPSTGLTVTATRSLDGAAFSSCANSVTEIANGWYKINLATTDLNANVVALRFTGTGADDCNITLVTQP